MSEKIGLAILMATAAGVSFGFWQMSLHAGIFMFLVFYNAYYFRFADEEVVEKERKEMN